MYKHRVAISEEAYTAMLDLLHSARFTDKSGTQQDITFMFDDFWLQDTVVIENIEKQKGCWNVGLVFAHYARPLQLIKRRITNFASFQKAVITAHYMRRLAAKDQRGTIQFDKNVIKYNNN